MNSRIALVGHPFSSIGMGEQLRAGYRAIRAAGLEASLFDVYRYAPRSDEDIRRLVLPNEAVTLEDSAIRIFHINGDEVDGVIDALAARKEDFKGGYNIIVPAWELPTYPEIWVEKLRQFDEVWAISKFVASSLRAAGIDNTHVGQAVELDYGPLLSRRYFGIRESSFTLLHFYDSKSYPSRKNPYAVIELYKRIRQQRPFADLQLVLKVRSGEENADEASRELREELPREARLITANLSAHEALSLIACNDCFVSLHRSEGFGRGLAEAMWFGRLALGTGWSGNCDYMDETNSLFVDHELVEVKEGEYPCWNGQKWAEPDLDHALALFLKAIDSSSVRKGITARGQQQAMRTCSNRAVGVRKLQRLRNMAIAK